MNEFEESKFDIGDRVKKRGSKGQWHGYICGNYSTSITPIGYAVESEREKGSVQIYPENALEVYKGQNMTNQDKIEEAKRLLEMIARDDFEILEEVNYRIMFLKHCVYLDRPFNSYKRDRFIKTCKIQGDLVNYTTSLDACKSIIPDSWEVTIKQNCEGFDCFLSKRVPNSSLSSYQFPTMELAWLHAILQAYIWEWETAFLKDKKNDTK